MKINQVAGAGPVPIDENRPYRRHAKMLAHLKSIGQLSDITGLAWYSWKDTGITQNVRSTTPMATRDQAGQVDFNVTLLYYHADPVNSEYKKLENTLLL